MPYDSHRSLGYWCARITSELRAKLEARTQEYGLTCTAAIVLVALDKHGPTTLVELAHWMEHAHPSVLRQIDALEETGHVERIPHEHDRRMKLVHLTEKGDHVLPAIHRSMREIQAIAMKGFSKSDAQELFDHLKKVASNLGLEEWAGKSTSHAKESSKKDATMNRIARQQ